MKIFNLKLLFSAASTLVALLFVSASATASETANGNVCMAANLNQAFELKWDHARVENPATNPYSRFVTCSMGAGPQWITVGGSTTAAVVETGGLTAYFSADAAATAEVSCIFREMSVSATDTVPADSKVAVITADDPLPDTASASFVKADGVNIGLGSTLTVTCKLDPGTGINGFGVGKTLPTPPS